MSRHVPTPLMQAFLACREIVSNDRKHEYLILGPVSRMLAPVFPANIQVSVYVYLTGGHGSYDLEFQLRDAADNLVWNWEPGTHQHADPLAAWQLAFQDIILPIPRPGIYNLIFLTNGVEAAQLRLPALLVDRAGG